MFFILPDTPDKITEVTKSPWIGKPISCDPDKNIFLARRGDNVQGSKYKERCYHVAPEHFEGFQASWEIAKNEDALVRIVVKNGNPSVEKVPTIKYTRNGQDRSLYPDDVIKGRLHKETPEHVTLSLEKEEEASFKKKDLASVGVSQASLSYALSHQNPIEINMDKNGKIHYGAAIS